MGKYLVYGLIILITLFILNWFQIIHIPFLDVPDFSGAKQETIQKKHDTVDQLK